MKKLFCVVSLFIFSILCFGFGTTVGALDIENESTYIKSGKTIKTSIPLNDTKYFKIEAGKKGKLKLKVEMKADDNTNLYFTNTTVKLYDSNSKELTSWSLSGNTGIDTVVIDKNYTVKKGTYYISVSHYYGNGCGDTRITVEYPTSDTDTVPAVVLKKGDTVMLGAIVSDVTLSTSDKKVAKVDSDGVVTGVSSGYAVVAIKDGKKSYKIGIIVK